MIYPLPRLRNPFGEGTRHLALNKQGSPAVHDVLQTADVTKCSVKVALQQSRDEGILQRIQRRGPYHRNQSKLGEDDRGLQAEHEARMAVCVPESKTSVK